MTISDPDFRSRVLLSVQRALIGEVTPQMRYIGVEFSPERIHIIVWHDGAVDESIRADFDAGAVTQAVAAFCLARARRSTDIVRVRTLRLSAATGLSRHTGLWTEGDELDLTRHHSESQLAGLAQRGRVALGFFAVGFAALHPRLLLL